MRAHNFIIVLFAAGSCLLPVRQAQAFRGGGGGFHGGGGGYSSYHSGGFSGGAGSVHYSGASHYGPATGFTHAGSASYSGAGGTAHYGSATHAGYGGTQHYSGASYAGAGGAAHYGETSAYHAGGYSEHSVNYGSIQHYDANARVATPYGYGGAVYHGPAGGTAAAYHGPYSSGAAVKGPAGYGAAVVKGPAGGTAAAYRGPYSSGAVAVLPSGYTATAWKGTSYYHYGYSFYRPTWYAGVVSYAPVYPPVGFFFGSLPTGATQTVVNNNTYYVADGVYYQPSAQNGQQGYTVAPAPSQEVAPQQSPAGSAAPQPAGGDAAPDPFPLLRKMSDYMGREVHVRMTVDETYDVVDPTGQKVQLSNQRIIRLKRPDKGAVDVTGPGIQRHIVLDGNNFTAIDLAKNVYATVPMEGSLDTAMDKLAHDYGMAQPVEDLLYRDIYERLAGRIQAGQFLGTENVAGRMCNHLAFNQTGVSWQIWIEATGMPVPRKLVITYDTTPGRPRYSLAITKWETPLEMSDAEFQVKLPDGAVSADLASLTGQAPAGQ